MNTTRERNVRLSVGERSISPNTSSFSDRSLQGRRDDGVDHFAVSADSLTARVVPSKSRSASKERGPTAAAWSRRARASEPERTSGTPDDDDDRDDERDDENEARVGATDERVELSDEFEVDDEDPIEIGRQRSGPDHDRDVEPGDLGV